VEAFPRAKREGEATRDADKLERLLQAKQNKKKRLCTLKTHRAFLRQFEPVFATAFNKIIDDFAATV